MTPLEIAARAAWNLHHPPNKPWEEVPEIIRKGKIREQAAALLALAECDFPDRIEFQDGNDTVILHPNNGASKGLFRKFCRAIANEGKDNG